MTRILSTFALSLALVAGLTTPASAQEATPQAEVFVGYSLFPANGDDFPRGTSHGFQADLAYNVNRWFGIAAGFGQQWSSTSDLGPNFSGLTADTTVRELLVGPRFTARSPRANVFGQAWFGRAIGDAGENFSGFSDSGVAFGGGGGVDIRLTPAVSCRAQLEYLGSFADIVDNNTRFAAGIVVGLGRR